jgi:hypothetical protein
MIRTNLLHFIFDNVETLSAGAQVKGWRDVEYFRKHLSSVKVTEIGGCQRYAVIVALRTSR